MLYTMMLVGTSCDSLVGVGLMIDPSRSVDIVVISVASSSLKNVVAFSQSFKNEICGLQNSVFLIGTFF